MEDPVEQARAEVRAAREAADAAADAAQQALLRYHHVLAEAQRQKILKQSELVDLTGYGREHLRRIARAAGVPSPRA
ncbi:hypothetical protein [Saccharopolyspora sp. NPDC049357]|uniref:hypothetical protein n=1 Tax=Saccharopolyspora sp. NPDC049357 TaxID=3154507 RepID=UPI00344AF096